MSNSIFVNNTHTSRILVVIKIKMPKCIGEELQEQNIYGIRETTYIVGKNGLISMNDRPIGLYYTLLDEHGAIYPDYVKKFEWWEDGFPAQIPQEKQQQIKQRLKEQGIEI